MRALVSVQATKNGWKLECGVCHESMEVSGELAASLTKKFHKSHVEVHKGESHGLVTSEKELI